MSMRFQKKSIYLLMFAAAAFVFVALLIFVYPRGTDPEEKLVGEPPSEDQSSESASDWPSEDDYIVYEENEGESESGRRAIEARAHTPEEMNRYIKRVGNSYRYAKKYLSQADVPALITLLDDPRQSKYWWDVETLLGFIDKEQESADALIDFIYREENWSTLSRRGNPMLAKADAISKIGFIGGDTVTDALKILLTEEGAKQLLSGWTDESVKGSGVSETLIRGKAAFGLVYTQEPANLQLVEAFYQSVFPQVRVIHQRPGTGSKYAKCETEEERQQYRLYTHALSAFGMRDYIESVGIERLKIIFFRPEMIDSAVSTHYRKYKDDLEE